MARLAYTPERGDLDGAVVGDDRSGGAVLIPDFLSLRDVESVEYAWVDRAERWASPSVRLT